MAPASSGGRGALPSPRLAPNRRRGGDAGACASHQAASRPGSSWRAPSAVSVSAVAAALPNGCGPPPGRRRSRRASASASATPWSAAGRVSSGGSSQPRRPAGWAIVCGSARAPAPSAASAAGAVSPASRRARSSGCTQAWLWASQPAASVSARRARSPSRTASPAVATRASSRASASPASASAVSSTGRSAPARQSSSPDGGGCRRRWQAIGLGLVRGVLPGRAQPLAPRSPRRRTACRRP